MKCAADVRHSHLRSFFRTPTQDTMANPVCFFDMTIGGEPAGRIQMTLRADVTPKTAGALSRRDRLTRSPTDRSFPRITSV